MAGVERRRAGAEMAQGRQRVVLRFGGRKDDGSRGVDGRWFRSWVPGRAVSDPPAEADFLAGRLLLRYSWRRTEIPDHNEGGRSQYRATLRPSKLGVGVGEIGVSRRRTGKSHSANQRRAELV